MVGVVSGLGAALLGVTEHRITERKIMQRPKNPGSRVALLPGKFLRFRKVFARMIKMIIQKSPILPCKKWEKLRFCPNQGVGGSDWIPTFWQNFPKLNLPCNCP